MEISGELFRRLRCPDVLPGDPPEGRLSLRSLVRGSRHIEFVHYNCWLLRASRNPNDPEYQPSLDSVRHLNPLVPKPAGSVSGDDHYCDDKQAKGPTDPTLHGDIGRIAYISAHRSQASHSYDPDASRIGRRAISRSNRTQPEYVLSEHPGLEVTLYASPK